MSPNANWQTIAAAHRQKQRDAIPPEWRVDSGNISKLTGVGTASEGRLLELQSARQSGLLDSNELSITEDFTAHQLLEKIHRGEMTSEAVTVAFCKRAAIAQQLTSCLTEIFFEEAIERAKWLDNHYRDTGKIVGPLHGLPISIKDSFTIKGHHATVGFVEYLKRPIPDFNSALVDLLLDAGAVLYCKTNVPQTMMTADSDNNVFGRTLNPNKTTLTAGGSTGGEGALVSFRGSPLGVGTDIAGSIRIPSACCGIYGFKPTSNRIPFAGGVHYPFPLLRLPGLITPVAGPMANSVEDLHLFMLTVVGRRPWKYDSTAVDIPWRTPDFGSDKKTTLTIGIQAEDEVYNLHHPVRRALEEAISALTRAGHKVVRLPADPQIAADLGTRIAFQFFGLAGPTPDRVAREIGEPLVPSVARRVHPFADGKCVADPEADIPVQISALSEAREVYQRHWQRVWFDNGLDVVLGPTCQSTAIPHDMFGVPAYTLMWNLLDYPAGVIPFGAASKHKDPEFQKTKAQFDPDYDPDSLDGAPCALQVVAPRFRDEECLEAMRIIDKAIR